MARPIWKGSIQFGLVNIPVQLETAVREKAVQFHLLSKDGSCRLRRKLVCADTGDEVNYNETARGIEIAKDQYVLVDEKELDKLKPEKGRAIEIEQFVKLSDIDPIYFDRVYFVTPVEGSAKAYKLLQEAMKDASRIGIAKFVMRDKQYIAAIRVMDEGIVLHTLHYSDEVLAIEDSVPATVGKAKPVAKEVQFAKQLIEAMTHSLDLSQYHDEYREQVEKMIEQKRSGKKTVSPADNHDDHPLPRTINLMDALKKSLAASKPTPKSASRRKSA